MTDASSHPAEQDVKCWITFVFSWQESLPLWQLHVQWSVANQSPEETEAVFKVAYLNPALVFDSIYTYEFP